jgi:pimeloyl-ACP methyl ester carboxylesterase
VIGTGTSDPAADLRYVDANGLRFAYLEQGTGPLVLLLHGFPDTAHTWGAVRARLASSGFRAVSPFMRGYRPSAIPDRDADAETLGRDALELICALGESSAIVVGHDWGASAAYGAAALDPQRVRQLVTLAIPHPATLRATPAKVWGVRHFITYKFPGAAARFARNDFAALPAIYRRWSPTWDPAPEEFAGVRACFADRASLDAAFGYYRALRFAPPAFLKRTLPMPAVAFVGTDDPTATRDDFDHAASMFSGSYAVEEVPGGHFLHREHPEAFIERLVLRLR